MDSHGNLYIGNFNGYIRQVDAGTGIITTILSPGQGTIQQAAWLGMDASDNLYISDIHYIWRVNVNTHALSVVAGNVGNAFNGDGIAATSASVVTAHPPIAVDGRP